MKNLLLIVGFIFSVTANAETKLNCQEQAEAAIGGALGLSEGDFYVNERFSKAINELDYQVETYPVVINKGTPEKYILLYVDFYSVNGVCSLKSIRNSRAPGEE